MALHYLGMAFVNVMWGLSFLLSRHALDVGFSPMALAFVRYTMAAGVLMPAMLLSRGDHRVQKRDWPRMFAAGLAGITLYYFFEYTGLTLTSTVNASLILAAIPILTLGVECALTRRKMTPVRVLGVLMSLAGAALVVGAGAGAGGSLPGDLCILGAAAVWVLYIFLCNGLRARYSSLTMNAWQALTALVTLLPLALLEGADLSRVPLSGWLCAAGLALVCSALCYLIYGRSLKHLTPTASAIFINLIPLTTMIGSLALGQRVTAFQWLGGALIIASILLVNGTGAPRAPAKAPPAV